MTSQTTTPAAAPERGSRKHDRAPAGQAAPAEGPRPVSESNSGQAAPAEAHGRERKGNLP